MDLKLIPIKTRVVMPPQDPIWDILDDLELADGDIVFITSKIMAIHQGRCVKAGSIDKLALIQQESSHCLSYKDRGGFPVALTIADNVLIPNAGIDESNANGNYILWPQNIDALCRELRAYLMQKNKNITKLGVVSTDSHTTPLRWGVTGIAIGLAGIEPLKDIRGSQDIFGRSMTVTQVNLIDPLTAMAVLLMGEAAEQVPIVILRGYQGIEFVEDGSMDSFKIPPEIDLYQPLLDAIRN